MRTFGLPYFLQDRMDNDPFLPEICLHHQLKYSITYALDDIHRV